MRKLDWTEVEMGMLARFEGNHDEEPDFGVVCQINEDEDTLSIYWAQPCTDTGKHIFIYSITNWLRSKVLYFLCDTNK